MNITDETLSAFLDSELPEKEMEAVRSRLVDEPALADRLAELAAVDAEVRSHYSGIDDRPMPDAISALLSRRDEGDGSVVSLTLWQRGRRSLRQRPEIATAAALVLGFAVALVTRPIPDAGGQGWAAVARALEQTPSGEVRELADGGQLTPKLTFVNQQGQYCRQFYLERNERASENIACRAGNDPSAWHRVAEVEVAVDRSAGRYQTASGGSVLDSALDRMMTGELLDRDGERRLIRENWQPSP